jgi:hypothetical protein
MASWFKRGDLSLWCSSRRKAASEQGNNFAGIHHTWLAPIFALEHRFVFQLKARTEAQKDVWFLPLSSFSGSSFIAWPVVAVVDGEFTRFNFKLDLDEPFVFPLVYCLDDFVGWSVQWRSPLWQYFNLNVVIGEMHSRVALYGDTTGSIPLFELACRRAFWNLNRTFVMEVGLNRGIEVERGVSIFDTLFTVIRQGLGLADNEDQVMEFISLRLHVNSLKESFAESLLEIDEAIDVFDRDDHQKVKNEQISTKVALAERGELAASFRGKRTVLRAAKSSAVASSSGSGGSRSAAPAAPDRTRWTSDVSQEDAKRLIPPGSSIWRGLYKRLWCGHCPPARRISAPWDGPGGQAAALQSVVQRLWLQHMEHNGLPRDVAPPGLFDVDPVPAAA